LPITGAGRVICVYMAVVSPVPRCSIYCRKTDLGGDNCQSRLRRRSELLVHQARTYTVFRKHRPVLLCLDKAVKKSADFTNCHYIYLCVVFVLNVLFLVNWLPVHMMMTRV